MVADSAALTTTRQFPRGVGIVLSTALALHVASLGEAIFGKPVSGAAAFLTGQFLISLALLRLYNGKWVFQDIRVFFAIFLFLYGASLPLVVVLGYAGSIPGLAGSAWMYGTAFLGYNLVQWWYRQPFHDISQDVFNRIRPTYINVALLVVAVAGIIGYALARGVAIDLTFNRQKNLLLGTQLWVVMIFVVNGLTMFMFVGWGRLTRTARIVVAASVLIFVAFQLLMGNRRDFLPMIVLIACVMANKRHMVIRAGTVITGSIAFVLFMAVGVVRQILADPGLAVRFNAVQLIVTQNEFVAPIYTLIHYVLHFRTPRLGMTYLAAPAQLLPRALWPDKPESLSLQFMRDAFGSTELMGFAYTPVTEAFLNFSWVGPFIVFAVWSLLLVKLVKSSDSHPAFYFLSFALCVDFHRGDFAGTFYAVVFVGGAYALMQLVSHLTWTAGERVRAGAVHGSPILRA